MSGRRLDEEKIVRMMRENLQGYALAQNEIGIGDDAALLAPSLGKLVTTDLLVEGIHFLKNKISAYELGYKSLAVNLSDIAAMGGEPQEAFLSLALPSDLTESWLQEWIQGFQTLAKRYGVRVFGGDTTASPGPIFINVVLNGKPAFRGAIRRDTACASDLLYVSGFLGDSKAGLMLLQNSESIKIPTGLKETLIKRHHQPRPHVEEGRWLGTRSEVSAMMDVSDGLWKDLGRLAQASKVGCKIQLENLPISPELEELGKILSIDTKSVALAGGEDYVLLWTVSESKAKGFEEDFEKEFGRPPFRIGTMAPFSEGIRYFDGNTEFTGPVDVFEHF